jgi:hypothetical protein
MSASASVSAFYRSLWPLRGARVLYVIVYSIEHAGEQEIRQLDERRSHPTAYRAPVGGGWTRQGILSFIHPFLQAVARHGTGLAAFSTRLKETSKAAQTSRHQTHPR